MRHAAPAPSGPLQQASARPRKPNATSVSQAMVAQDARRNVVAAMARRQRTAQQAVMRSAQPVLHPLQVTLSLCKSVCALLLGARWVAGGCVCTHKTRALCVLCNPCFDALLSRSGC